MTNITKVFDQSLAVKLHNWHSTQADPIYSVGSLIQSGEPVTFEDAKRCVKSLSETFNIVKSRDPFKTRTNDFLELLYLMYELESVFYSTLSPKRPQLNRVLERITEGYLQPADEGTRHLAPVEVMMLLGKVDKPPSVKMGGLLPYPNWRVLFKNEEEDTIIYGLNHNQAIARIAIELRQ